MYFDTYLSGQNKQQRSFPKQSRYFLLSVISGSALCAFLSGCTFMRAVTFDQDEKRSGILFDQQTYLRVIFEKQETDKWPEPLSHLPRLPDSKIFQDCTGYPPVQAVLPIVPLVTLGAVSVMDIATTAIEGYIAGKRRLMEKNYEAHINELEIALPPVREGAPKPVRCIDLVRTVEIERKQMVAMRAIFQFKTIGLYHYLQPIYLTVPYAAAVTEQNKGIKLAVNTRVNAAIVANNLPKLVNPINENFIFHSVALGKVYHYSPETKEQLQLKEYVSPIFIWPTTSPVSSTIFVSVTEIGSGVEVFDKATPQLQGASKQINEAIKAIIKEGLGE